MIGSSLHAWAGEEKDELDVESEMSMAEADGSSLNAGYLNQKAEQQKLDTRMDVSHAEKAIRAAKTQQVYSEIMIEKAQTEMQSLKKEQADALLRRQKALADRKIAVTKLARTLKELKAYRARVKQAQALAMKEERVVAAVNSRTAKLQTMMPLPSRKTTGSTMKPQHSSHASMAEANR